MLTLGIDSGSTTTKGALFDGTQIVKTAILPTSANPKDSICNLYEMLYNDDVAYTVSTGYGRALYSPEMRRMVPSSCSTTPPSLPMVVTPSLRSLFS